MEIIKICVFALLCAVAVMVLREHNGNIATLIIIAGGVIIVALVVDEYSGIISTLLDFALKANIATEHFSIIFKIVSVGYVGQITTDILDEINVKSLSSKVAFSTKIIILLLCLPIVLDLFYLICEVL